MMPYHDTDWKRSWIDNLNGTELQVSNDVLFENYRVNPQTIILQNHASFKYLRVYCEKTFLGKLQLMDDSGMEITYSPIENGKTFEINWERALDDDPLTFSGITKPSSNLKLDKPRP